MCRNLLSFYLAFDLEKGKVDFLKSEYKKYLSDTKKRILGDHIRNSRSFQPIILKLSLLLHEQTCLLPDYLSFKETMDAPTKAVADFLLEKLLRISNNLLEEMKQTMYDLQKFDANITAKHIGEVRGWHTTIPMDIKKEQLMFVVLFDSKKYIS